jgi:hypothetical protein
MSISYTNKYQPPKPAQLDAEVHLHTPPEEYDVKWIGGPVGPVKTDRLLLVPFIVSPSQTSLTEAFPLRTTHAAKARSRSFGIQLPDVPARPDQVALQLPSSH